MKRSLAAALLFTTAGCSSDLPPRQVPTRGTLGTEFYSLICDRVGAQALREDVTGASFHNICHADSAGTYASRVDASQLPPLDPNARDTEGHPVTLAVQESNRAHRIARIEALARRRIDLVKALDHSLPDKSIAVRSGTGATSCTLQKELGSLHTELAKAVSRLTGLYNDRTIPKFTESISHLLDTIASSPDTQQALARLNTRRGYRPSHTRLGIIRPLFAYPRIVDLADSLLPLVARKDGSARPQFEALLAALYEETRTADPTPSDSKTALSIPTDPLDPMRTLPSRPRTNLEFARSLFLAESDSFAAGSPSYIVRRDPRGLAAIHLENNRVPLPFVDKTGPLGAPDALPDVDSLGRFITGTGTSAPTPFDDSSDLSSPKVERDSLGFAKSPSRSTPIYDYYPTHKSFLGAILRDIRPFINPDVTNTEDTLMNIAAAAPVLLGSRDPNPTHVKSYGNSRLSYRAFHSEDSPLVDLAYAFGQVASDPTFDDTLVLVRELLEKHPEVVARFIGIGLKIKGIADAHPEAHLPEQSKLWDELLEVFGRIAQAPGVLEQLITALGSEQSLKLKETIATYLEYKDELTYNRDDLNGLAFNETTRSVVPLMTPFLTPVDRSLPDSGKNRSAMQRFMQLLHDANGLSACTKEGAVAHVDIHWNGLPVKLDYPNSPLAKVVCAFLGAPLPSRMPACGILRIENVMGLLLDVALDRAKFDIRDECLNKIVSNPTLTGLVGGADAFLEEISGIKGFSMHPTVNGVSRLVYFDTPHDGLPGDEQNPKTLHFLHDIIDPVPSMVCPGTTFKDSDGKILQLRQCASFKDTLRGRDNNALFPLEEMNFVENVRPLAAAFADNGQPLLFVDLFDTLHLHWGSKLQSKEECDPSGDRKTNWKWCSQDAVVSYEPILAKALQSDLFPAIHDFVPILKAQKIRHCASFDSNTNLCKSYVDSDGVHVLSEALRSLVDPKRSRGLKDRRGKSGTPMELLIDAFKGIDTAFANYRSAHPSDPDRQPGWKSARSALVDTFFAVDGDGTNARLRNGAWMTLLPQLLTVVREQLVAHCPSTRQSGKCAWAQEELPKKLSESIEGPVVASTVDMFDAIRKT